MLFLAVMLMDLYLMYFFFLLLNLYYYHFILCFHRNEGLNLKIVESHEEAKKYEYSIYIKYLNNIWVYLKKSIKFHKPIYYNINDEIIKKILKIM